MLYTLFKLDTVAHINSAYNKESLIESKTQNYFSSCSQRTHILNVFYKGKNVTIFINYSRGLNQSLKFKILIIIAFTKKKKREKTRYISKHDSAAKRANTLSLLESILVFVCNLYLICASCIHT